MRKELFLTVVSLVFLMGCGTGGQIAYEQSSEAETPPATSAVVSEATFGRAVAQATVSYDEFDEETVYEIDTPVGYPDSFEDSVALRIKVTLPDGGEPRGVLLIYYGDEDWIFFETLEARSGGETYELANVASYDKSTSVRKGWVSEVGAENLTPDLVETILFIADDSSAKLRLSGDKGVVERPFTPQERIGLRYMANIYLGLKQGLRQD